MRVAVDTNILIYLFRDPNATAANEEQADLQRGELSYSMICKKRKRNWSCRASWWRSSSPE